MNLFTSSVFFFFRSSDAYKWRAQWQNLTKCIQADIPVSLKNKTRDKEEIIKITSQCPSMKTTFGGCFKSTTRDAMYALYQSVTVWKRFAYSYRMTSRVDSATTYQWNRSNYLMWSLSLFFNVFIKIASHNYCTICILDYRSQFLSAKLINTRFQW